MRMLFTSLFGIITNIEQGFWHTMITLFIRPWVLLEDFLSGKTIRYYNPFRYLFILTGISSVLVLSLGLFDYQVENMNELMGVTANEQALARQVQTMQFVRKYFNLISLLFIPFIALAAKWVFRRRRLNYAEMLIITAFLYGQLQLISLVVQASGIYLAHFNYNQIMLATTLTSTIYYVFSLKTFFGYSVGGVFWRSLAVQILGFLLFMLVSMLLGLLIGIGIALMGGLPGK